MDFLLSFFKDMNHNFGQGYYIVLGLIILILFFLIHLYSLKKEKKKLRNTIDHNLKVFQKAFDIADDAMLILSEENKVIYANKSMVSLLGLDKEYESHILKEMPQIKIKKEWINLDQFLKDEQSRITQKALKFPQAGLRTQHNRNISINLYLDTLALDATNNQWYNIITMQDLTRVQEFEGMGYTHTLTGLPNQIQAMNDLPILFSKIHLNNNKVALVLLGFNQFSRLRSIIGYEQSNDVIIKFSKYLNSIVNDMNIQVYHTFDNYFLLMVSNVESVDNVKALVQDIQKKLVTFYKIEESNLHLTVSAGIAIYPDSGPTRKLLDNTYKALAQAQKEGDGKVIVYTPDNTAKEFDELTLHNDMQNGLENGEFEVYYQPIVRTIDQEIVKAEAFVRWVHPQMGIIPPDVFIGIMEKTGFIIHLGRFVLGEVLKQQKRWQLFKFKEIDVSINVSMLEIASGGFVEHIEEQLKHHQVNPERITLEITEGMAMINELQTEKYFRALKKLGVSIALDDFGTGYTSFSYLKKFPANFLKIDKSIIDNLLTHDENKRILKAIIELGHNLGMQVIVEGVEKKKILEELSSYGCEYLQGYYLGKPLPVFEFQKLLR